MLKIIYGRSGSGKSEYIYNDIKEKLGNKKIYLIVPEQCNLSVEKKLIYTLDKKSIIDVEVLTLSRMAYRVAQEMGGENTHISKVGKDMLIFDLLSEEKGKLNFLGKSDSNIDVVNRLFTEFKKHNVSIDDLKKCKIEDKYTKLKLEDIIKLYEKYEERLKDKFIDENDLLNILVENLSKKDVFKDTLIYIDEFLGFTKQEYNVFECLLKQANDITVGISLDVVSDYLDIDNDIFYFNKKFANNLISIAKNNNIKFECEGLNELKRFKSNELILLENNLSGNDFKVYKDKTSDINLFLANNPYSELEYVAQTIHNLVKKCGYKYKEIGIITEELDRYSEDARVICNKYDIPYFIDEKKQLNQNILIKFVISMLDIFAQNWSFESVFNYLKLGLLDIDFDDLCLFENYCRKWGVKYNKFHKKFEYEKINDIQDKMEEIRVKFVNPLLEFKDNVSKNRTVYQITKEIYAFLNNNNISLKLDEKIKSYNSEEITNEYNTSYKLFIDILDELCLIFKDEKITFDKYKNLLQVGFNASELGKIPATQDQVIIGDTERTRSNNLKVVFVIGINDGNYPKAIKAEGYLNDSDRNVLLDNGIELAKNTSDSLREEQFNIYRTLTTPSEKLYLTYSSSDKAGASIRPSILIKKIKRMFPNISEESDIIEKKYEVTNELITFENALNIYRDYLDGKKIPEKWDEIINYFYETRNSDFEKAIKGLSYDNKPEEITKENIDELYGNYMKTSVSRLESYRRCPFAFHLTYGLKLKEKEELQLNPIDTGSFMHEVIDKFFNRIDEEEKNLRDLSSDDIKNIIDIIVDEMLETSSYYIFTSTAKFKVLTRKLKKVIFESLEYIIYTIVNSDFRVYGHEVEFGSNSQFETIKFEVDGKKVELSGKIDRIDTAKLGDRQFVRIIDYKSSNKNVDINQVVSGLQIQLVTYLDAITEQTNFESSGILYMKLIENIVSGADKTVEKDLEKSIRKNLRMNGIVLADIKVVKMMDNTLEKGSSDIIPVKLNKDGDISSSSSVLDKEKFDKLKQKVREVIKEISKEILNGKIDIKPYNYKNSTGCDYCNYKNICNFSLNLKGNSYNYIKKTDEL